MYVAMNHIRAVPEQGVVLEERFGKRARLVDEMEGFRSFELFAPAPLAGGHGDADPEYLVVTSWKNSHSFDRWRASEENQRAHPGERGSQAPSQQPRAWLTTHESFESAYTADWQAALLQAAQPIAVMNAVTIGAGFAPVFEKVFGDRDGSVEERPGFLTLEVLRPVAGSWAGLEAALSEAVDPTYLVFSRWASEEQHRAWVQSEDFRRAHGRNRLPEGAVVKSNVHAFRILHPSLAPTNAQAG
jgi:heme oxygenase (mycobilin-producing)